MMWVVYATHRDQTWTVVDSVWSSRLGALQRADYIRDNEDKFGDRWHASVVELAADQCTPWPRESRDA